MRGTNVTDTTWKHVGLTGKISVAPSKTLQRVSRRRLPWFFTSPTSAEIIEMWRVIRNRRNDLKNWEFIPLRGPPVGV